MYQLQQLVLQTPFYLCNAACHIRHLRKMMVGRRFAPYSLYFVVRIDLSTLKAHPKTAQSKHDLCVGLLYSKHIEGEDHVPNSAYNQHSYKNCMFISIRERKLVGRQLSFSGTYYTKVYF